MYALIENNEIKKIYNNPRALKINDIQYPRSIFSLWTKEELEAKGICEVIFDNTNKKDEAYYNNTNQSFDYDNGVVTASFGTATAKRLNDENAKDEDGNNLLDEDGNQVINYGLKTEKKRIIKQQASGLLTPTDWYILKEADAENYAIPSAITTYRVNVRATSNEMEAKINACTTVDELAALYEYVGDPGSRTRPLGEFPTLEI
tara:strand:+ start:1 stop:612 length:612 start_codon:yes stop_codon:yes gene_type:complete